MVYTSLVMNNPPAPREPGRIFWPLALCLIFSLAVGVSLAAVLRSAARLKTFLAQGVVRKIDPAESTVSIQHAAIPGFMPAMTMPFVVKDTNALAGLAPGDAVAFQITVSARDGWIDHLQKLPPGRDPDLPTTGPFRLVRDVEPLAVGDPLPDYRFTNELGRTVWLHDFQGQALAITFVFTRCPYPTFCPRMSDLFADTIARLAGDPQAPANVHFLTVSFDPDYDTPERLQAYAELHHYNPQRWSFLTGQLLDITALADAFGMEFWHDGANLNHNLRTAVVDAGGRVQTVLTGNSWTAETLAAEMVNAARMPVTK
jgi:protein SCO1/2